MKNEYIIKRQTKWCLPCQRNCSIYYHPNNITSNCSGYVTVDYLWLLLWECGSPALQWCYLRCSALADRWPLGPPPLLVGFWSFPWPQVASCLLWLGRSWGGTCESLKTRSCQGLCWLSSGFSWRVAKFFADSIFHFHFHKSSCCYHPASQPCDHVRVPAWDLLPPAAALYGEATLCWFIPPSTPPLSCPSWGTGGCLFGWAEASPGAA